MPKAEPLPQFPQPTRPAFVYETDSSTREEYHHPESLSLPKPEPETSYASTDTQEERDGVSSPSDRISLSAPTGKTPKGEKEAVDELLMILIECMEELNTRSRETLLRKFFSEIEREERLERFIVERLKQSRVKAITDLCEKLPEGRPDGESDRFSTSSASDTEEGEQVQPPVVLTRSITESVEELSEKLARFKVRTIDLGGPVVVKEEEEAKN